MRTILKLHVNEFLKTLLMTMVLAFTIVFVAEATKKIIKLTEQGVINWQSRY